MAEITDDIVRYLEGELGIDTAEVDVDAELFSTGIIDSFSLISLVNFIEERFAIRVGPLDVSLANFDTLGRMTAYIERSGGVAGS